MLLGPCAGLLEGDAVEAGVFGGANELGGTEGVAGGLDDGEEGTNVDVTVIDGSGDVGVSVSVDVNCPTAEVAPRALSAFTGAPTSCLANLLRAVLSLYVMSVVWLGTRIILDHT